MKYKTMYGIHEGRMIVEKILIPLVVGGLVFFSNEDNKKSVKESFNKAKNFVSNKIESLKSKKEETVTE